jgi:hypothetical protein
MHIKTGKMKQGPSTQTSLYNSSASRAKKSRRTAVEAGPAFALLSRELAATMHAGNGRHLLGQALMMEGTRRV